MIPCSEHIYTAALFSGQLLFFKPRLHIRNSHVSFSSPSFFFFIIPKFPWTEMMVEIDSSTKISIIGHHYNFPKPRLSIRDSCVSFYLLHSFFCIDHIQLSMYWNDGARRFFHKNFNYRKSKLCQIDSFKKHF